MEWAQWFSQRNRTLDILVTTFLLKALCPGELTEILGPSSNIAFTRRIVRSTTTILKNAASAGTPISPEDYIITSHALRISRPTSPIAVHAYNSGAVSIGTEPFILPPQGETLHLIELYFSATGILFPYIDKESFLQTYQQLSLMDIVSVRRSWLGLLNVVLAMATTANTGHDTTLSAQERASKSDVFFRRAWMLCDRQIRHGASLEIGMQRISMHSPFTY